VFRELEARVRELFARENVEEASVVLSYALDLRYVGQEHTLSVPAPSVLENAFRAELDKSFDELHLKVYGHNAPEEPKEIVSLKVTSIAGARKPTMELIPSGSAAPEKKATMGKRKVYVGGGSYEEFRIFRRDLLLAGNRFSGPALVEEATATTVVEKGQTCTVDRHGNLIIALNQE
jgi:N-methylhydantoinase A